MFWLEKSQLSHFAMAMAATGAGSGGGRRKRLTAHLEAAFAEIERLADVYLAGIETLERNVRAGLSTSAVRKWFLLVRTCSSARCSTSLHALSSRLL